MADTTDLSAEAPFFADVAAGPAAESRWLSTADGVRLRAVHWDAGGAAAAPRGTVLLFTGRTEYAEKYGRVAADLAARGFATATVDWRGQGLSERRHPSADTGHVESFADYQSDVAALLEHVARIGLPKPLYLLAHSMGGCIGLRALAHDLPVRAVCFAAPMWGIQLRGAQRPMAWGLSALSRPLGLSHLQAPGRSGTLEDAARAASANMLTGDAESFAWMQAQVAAHPELELGDPSLHWLHEALLETRALAALPSPALPCLTLLGSDERIVDIDRIERRMASWPGGRLLRIDGGRHELLAENATRRGALIDRIAGHFAPLPRGPAGD